MVPDVEEPYAPLPSGLAVPLEANQADIAAALKQIPEMFASGRHGLPCGAAAIKACVEALKPTGGRVLAFVATMPTGGYGAVKGRTAVGTAMSKEMEKEPVKHAAPADKVYSKMATEAAEYQCAIDAFLLPNGHVDVASLGHLCRVTGGSLYRYHDFNTALDFAQLHNDLRWNVTRPQGLEAVMRVRASAGLGVADYGGFFCKRTPTDVDLPALDCDKAISVDLRYEEKLADGQDAFAQCALLYTTMRGERRIRVHTLALPVSSVLGNVFRASDLEAQTCDMIRRASAKLLAGTCSLQGAKDGALRTTVDTLHAYRKFCASNNSTGNSSYPKGSKCCRCTAWRCTNPTVCVSTRARTIAPNGRSAEFRARRRPPCPPSTPGTSRCTCCATTTRKTASRARTLPPRHHLAQRREARAGRLVPPRGRPRDVPVGGAGDEPRGVAGDVRCGARGRAGHGVARRRASARHEREQIAQRA